MYPLNKTLLATIVASTTAAIATPTAHAATVDVLDQRIRILERQLEIQKEESAAAAAKTPIIKVGEKGVSLSTLDGAFVFSFRALAQGDHRWFFDDDALTAGAATNTADGFRLRRVMPTFEGQLGSLVGFRITPDFAPTGSTTESSQISDAYVDLKFSPAATLRAGKQKSPVGLERLQSSASTTFAELAFPSELAPNRNIGAQLQGNLLADTVSYSIGSFNGAADGRSASASDPDDLLELGGRVFFQPWLNQPGSPLNGFGFGLGATGGKVQGSGNEVLPRYRSPGQVTVFSYSAADSSPTAVANAKLPVEARGRHYRYSPQAHFYRGPLGLLAEYIVSDQGLGRGSNAARVQHSAWAGTVSYVLTGEDASYKGVSKPYASFNPAAGGWGAIEIAGRVSGIDFDDQSFKKFSDGTSLADANKSVSQALAFGLGVNWHLNSNLKAVVNYQYSQFDGGAKAGGDRDSEQVLISRIQYAF